MDVDDFDAWTRGLPGHRSRRAVLSLLAGGAGALGLTRAGAGAKKKKRCKKADRGCGKGKRCCAGLGCTDKTCCPPDRVFVNCSEKCLCVDNPDVCCAYEPELPEDCGGPSDALEFCCLESSICGDNDERCCDPGATCVDGNCQCLLENVCGASGEFCCNPEKGFCNNANVCECFDLLDCPSGTGGFARVRRL